MTIEFRITKSNPIYSPIVDYRTRAPKINRRKLLARIKLSHRDRAAPCGCRFTITRSSLKPYKLSSQQPALKRRLPAVKTAVRF